MVNGSAPFCQWPWRIHDKFFFPNSLIAPYLLLMTWGYCFFLFFSSFQCTRAFTFLYQTGDENQIFVRVYVYSDIVVNCIRLTSLIEYMLVENDKHF